MSRAKALTAALKKVKELVDAGYPEEVAERIASGKLPMDEASRAARAAEQGYGDVMYRGHNNKRNPVTSSQDMWMTDSPSTAQTYADAYNKTYAPEAPEFEDWYSYYKEGDISDVSNEAELKSLKKEHDRFLKTWNDTQPTPPGVVTPLRHNATELAHVKGGGRHFPNVETNSLKLKGLQRYPATRGVHRGTDNIAEAVKHSDAYQGTVFTKVKDDFQSARGAQTSTVHNVLGSRPDVNIRHADAAFDPEYKGSNIMGNADVGLLTLLAGGSAGASVLLNSLFADAERAKK